MYVDLFSEKTSCGFILLQANTFHKWPLNLFILVVSQGRLPVSSTDSINPKSKGIKKQKNVSSQHILFPLTLI